MRILNRDSNIVSRSFRLLSSGLKEPEKLMKRTDYDLELSYFSTAPGDNRYINPLPGFGFNTDPMPEQRIKNDLGNLGRYYKRIYDDNATLLTLTAGVAEFSGIIRFVVNMFDYSASVIANKGRAPSWAFYIGQGIGSIAFYPMQIVGVAFNFLGYLFGQARNQWYYVKPAMGEYYAAAQGIFNDLMVQAGYSLTVFDDSRKEQGNIKHGDRDYMQGGLTQYDTTALKPDTTQYKIKENNIKFLNSLYNDSLNSDGTIDILKLANRGVRKYRHFLMKVKELDKLAVNNPQLTMTHIQKEDVIYGVLEELVDSGQFMNGKVGLKATRGNGEGGEVDHYLKRELQTTARARGENEISYPEMASSYYDPAVGKNIIPVDENGNTLSEYGTTSSNSEWSVKSINDRFDNILKGNTNETPPPTGSFSTSDVGSINNTNRSLESELPSVDWSSINSNISDEGYFSQIAGILKDGFLGGLDCVTFRVEGGGGTVSDSFSSQTGPSPLAGMFNGTVQAIQDFKFSTQGGQTGIGIIDSFVGMIKDGVAGLAAGSVIGNIPMALLGNAHVNIADHWTDSSSNLHSESYSIYCEASCAHPYAIATSIFLPLSLIAPFIFPISTGGGTYSTPFLVKAFSRGRTIIRTGIVRNATFTFGSGPMGWTRDMKPLNLRIDLDIEDLEKVVAMPVSRIRNPLDALNLTKQTGNYLGDIGKYNDWTARVAGVDYLDTILKYNDLNKRITRFTNDFQHMFSPSNVAGVVNDSIIGDVARIFTQRPLNR